MSTITHICDPEGECFCVYDPKCNPVVAAHQREKFQRGVQALLGVLNDIGGGNPWNYNVITEAAEDALEAALRAMA